MLLLSGTAQIKINEPSAGNFAPSSAIICLLPSTQYLSFN